MTEEEALDVAAIRALARAAMARLDENEAVQAVSEDMPQRSVQTLSDAFEAELYRFAADVLSLPRDVAVMMVTAAEKRAEEATEPHMAQTFSVVASAVVACKNEVERLHQAAIRAGEKP